MELERALTRVMQEPVKITGAGRTDAGVHAAGQVINFKTTCRIPVEKICVALNSALPRDIVLVSAEESTPAFSARFSAKSRTYEYSILNADQPSALRGRFTWHVPGDLDLAAMRRAAGHLLGKHDFSSFCLAGGDSKTKVRELKALKISRRGELVVISLEANAFLHSMVRGIVGTLVEVGQGRRRPSDIRIILESKDRGSAGRTAPARGLCLLKVAY